MPDRPEKMISEFRFSVIVPTEPMTYETIFDATDALGDAGCTDASIRGHADGIELLFERTADSLQAAIESAVRDVEQAGFRVKRVEMEREEISTAD